MASIVWSLLDAFDGSDLASAIVYIAIAAAIIWYLRMPGVREAFGRPAPSAGPTA